MTECIHGLGPVACCTICNGKDAVPEYKRAIIIRARFGGICSECDLPWEPGDSISWYPDHNLPTLHARCV